VNSHLQKLDFVISEVSPYRPEIIGEMRNYSNILKDSQLPGLGFVLEKIRDDLRGAKELASVQITSH
jgi:hypothetical protein